METSFIIRLGQTASQSECSTPTPSTACSVDNPEPQHQDKKSTILVKFGGDPSLRRFDPAFLKYTFKEVTCENEEESKVISSHCCQQNAGFFRQIGNKQEELKCYQMLLKTNPNQLSYLTKAAILNFQLSRYQFSINYYKSINVLYPSDSKAFYNLSVCLKRSHRWGEAKAVLERYLGLAPNDPEGYKDLADVLMELNERKQAIQMLEKCIQISPKDSQAFNTLGNLYFSTNSEKAIQYYLSGISANPANSYNFNGLGVIYNSMRQYERAVCEFQRAIGINPDEADFYYNLAIAFRELKNIEKAEKSFKTSLQVDPTYYLSYEGLGNLSLDAHQLSQAIRYYELALQFCPDFVNALFNLSLAQQRNGNLAKAAQCLQRYLQLKPTDFDVYHRLAELYSAIKCKERLAREQQKQMPRVKRIQINFPKFAH